MAATIVVNNGGDIGSVLTCTLRQAVLSANTNAAVGTCTAGSAGQDTISLNGISGTITLSSQIVVTESVTIQGAGASRLAISGNHANRIFDVVDSGSPVVLSIDGLTLRDGLATNENGGCIRAENLDSYGQVAVSNSVVTGCVSTATTGNSPAGAGGAIYSNGYGSSKYDVDAPSVLLQNSTISGNSATLSGGGVAGLSVRSENSIVGNNLVNGWDIVGGLQPKYGGGGGVFSLLSIINNSTISGNQVKPSIIRPTPVAGVAVGGGIFTALALVQNSTVSQNRISGTTAGQGTSYNVLYGGGIAALLAAQITNSTVSGNVVTGNPMTGSGGQSENWIVGAGLMTTDKYSLQAGIHNSTIAGNTVEASGTVGSTNRLGPAGIAFLSALSGTDRALFNKAKQIRGANALRGAATAVFGPAAAAASGQTVLYSSIVSNSIGGPDIGCRTYQGACPTAFVIAGGRNLIMAADASVTVPGDTLTGDPLLGILTDNGGAVAGAPGVFGTGPNKTHGLGQSSPALNTGGIAMFPPPFSGPLGFDQRGPGFPRVSGGVADIGAVEETQAPLVIPTLSSYSLGLLSVLLAFMARWRRGAPHVKGK